MNFKILSLLLVLWIGVLINVNYELEQKYKELENKAVITVRPLSEDCECIVVETINWRTNQ